MKRMTPEKYAEWRRKSVERYRAKRHGVPTLCSAETFIRDDLHEAVECVLRARHLGEHKGETSSGAVWWTDEHLEWDPFHSNYRSAAPSRQKHLSRAKKLVTPQRARKQAEDAEYRRNREMRLVRARGRCEWVLPDRGVFGRGTPVVVWQRDGGVCGVCWEALDYSEFEVDHIVPLSRGGLHEMANVQAAHRRCNRSKGAKPGATPALIREAWDQACTAARATGKEPIVVLSYVDNRRRTFWQVTKVEA